MLTNQFDLIGKTALVTGGATGMGYCYSQILAEAGARVMIAARREDRLMKAAAEISNISGGKVDYCQADLSDRATAIKLIRHANEIMGGLDILVGNAGIEVTEPIENFSDENYDALLAINLTSNVFMTREAIPIMKAKGWGRIIFTGSISTQTAFKNLPVGLYATAKSGLEGFARFAAVELADQGITVNIIAPGGIRTEMVDQATAALPADEAQSFLGYQAAMTAMNRWGEPRELSGALLLLASDAGSYITGTTLTVDGGYLAMGDSILA